MLFDFKEEEKATCLAEGFVAGWIGDIAEGDVVCIPPVSRTTFGDGPEPDIEFVVVERINRQEGSYVDEDGEWVQNTVINFIGINEDGLDSHYSYGSGYNCFIFKA